MQLFANYNKDITSWENRFDAGYGLSKIEDQTLKKSEDIIDLQSKLGIKASENWYYSASSASIDTRMIYDDDIEINGSPEIQFKEILGIGFNVKF